MMSDWSTPPRTEEWALHGLKRLLLGGGSVQSKQSNVQGLFYCSRQVSFFPILIISDVTGQTLDCLDSTILPAGIDGQKPATAKSSVQGPPLFWEPPLDCPRENQ